MRRRPKAVSILVLVALFAVIWSVCWVVAISFAKHALASERQKLSARGIDLSCETESWGGYPLRFVFDCVSPAVEIKAGPRIAAARLNVTTWSFQPWRLVATVDGPSVASLPQSGRYDAAHGPALLTVTVNAGLEPGFEVGTAELSIPDLLRSGRLSMNIGPVANGRRRVTGSARDISYQPTGRPELLVDTADLQGILSESGELTVERIALQQGKVRYWGSGAVALDAGHRISGKLSTETNDLDGLLAILEPHLDMNDQQKTGFRTVLGLLGNEAKADVIARNGELFIGPFKAADLGPLF